MGGEKQCSMVGGAGELLLEEETSRVSPSPSVKPWIECRSLHFPPTCWKRLQLLVDTDWELNIYSRLVFVCVR